MDVRVYRYNGVKYNKDSEKVARVTYRNIQSFEVVTGERATEIGLTIDEDSRDEFNEYLVITHKDGGTSIYCNSHVDSVRV